jgi:hypothetical protein
MYVTNVVDGAVEVNRRGGPAGAPFRDAQRNQGSSRVPSRPGDARAAITGN